MSTLSQLVYKIKNLSKEISDDSTLNFALLSDLIRSNRAVLIRREYGNKRVSNPQISQPLGCWELEQVDKSECCDIETECYAYRTKLELPGIVEVQDKLLFTYIGSVDNDTDFQLISRSRNRWIKYQKYTKFVPFATIKNNRLYIVNDKYISNITMSAVLENPQDASKYNHCDGKPCFSPDDKYPMPNWMDAAIIDMLKKNELSIYFTAYQDKTNDGNYSKEPTQTN